MTRVGLTGLLILTMLIAFYTITLFTSLIMAPWDTALVRPEIGTWQRTLNDFFEYGGALAISIPLLAVVIALTLPILRQGNLMLFRLAAGNLVFCAVMWAAFLTAAFVNNQLLFPYPPVTYDPTYAGFHRSLLPVAAQIVVCAAWLLWLRQASKRDTPSSTLETIPA